MQDFTSFPKIDAHLHYNADRSALLDQAAVDGFRLLSINTEVPFFPSIVEQERLARYWAEKAPGQLFFAVTFSTHGWLNSEWAAQTARVLSESLSHRYAIGVKIWKNIGMDLRYPDGPFLMVDDARLQPLLDVPAAHGQPLLGHQGEPRNCWLPVEQMTVQSDAQYFSAHPEYHMYLHPEFPSYQEQIAARDRLLAHNPQLNMIGLHLASLEWDVDEVAARLDRFPHLAVDLAERICHLQVQSVEQREKVRRFMLRYQDRIIYGTDVIDDGSRAESEIRRHIAHLWQQHWQYFSTDDRMNAPEFAADFRGLALPEEVLRKIYFENACRWYPKLGSSIKK
jgi:predicted TIM-barrel fold metal-dependent hydrolase